MILTSIVRDNLHKWTLLLWILKYNTILRSKKLNIHYKQTTPESHDFNVFTSKLPSTRSVFILKMFFLKVYILNSLQEWDYKHNDDVKVDLWEDYFFPVQPDVV